MKLNAFKLKKKMRLKVKYWKRREDVIDWGSVDDIDGGAGGNKFAGHSGGRIRH